MTDQKPNCETCTISQCPLFSITAEGCKPTDSSVHYQKVLTIRKCGCLSHPDARAYLMRDVIKRLESAINSCDNPDKEDAFEYAISLIKGVKE